MIRKRLSSEPQQAALPSERSFGLLMAFVCALGSGYGMLRGWPPVVDAALAAASLSLLLAAFVAPTVLRPLNKAWFALGMLLSRIVSPIVLGAIYFLVLAPVAVATRGFGRDELRLDRRQRDSHWIDRQPPGPAPESFRQQF